MVSFFAFVFSALLLVQLPTGDGQQLAISFLDARETSKYIPNLLHRINRPVNFDYGIFDEEMQQGRNNRLLERKRPLIQNATSDDESKPSSRMFIRRQSSVVGDFDGINTVAPSTLNSVSNFSPCVSANGVDQGMCLPSPVCSLSGGRSLGSSNCRFLSTCCIIEVSRCDTTPLVTMNNTYWQSPTAVLPAGGTCRLFILLNPRLIEQQRKPTCQIRLDFINFSIAQPNSESVCSVDSFQVIGATNKVPVICGDNNGQHMYLFVPPNPKNVQLIMSFGTSPISRFWRIKIRLLPCDTETDYLAPNDCLQYYTSASGTIKSFNWMDTTATATRQLANQDYHICFRTEIIGQQLPITMCLSQCQVSAGTSFSLSGPTATSQSLAPTDCSNDYMVFAGGYQLPITTPLNPRDRFCGNVFAQGASATTPDTICSTAKSFRVVYKTNGDETITAPQDTNKVLGNQGFCLQYQQRLI